LPKTTLEPGKTKRFVCISGSLWEDFWIPLAQKLTPGKNSTKCRRILGDGLTDKFELQTRTHGPHGPWHLDLPANIAYRLTY